MENDILRATNSISKKNSFRKSSLKPLPELKGNVQHISIVLRSSTLLPDFIFLTLLILKFPSPFFAILMYFTKGNAQHFYSKNSFVIFYRCQESKIQRQQTAFLIKLTQGLVRLKLWFWSKIVA